MRSREMRFVFTYLVLESGVAAIYSSSAVLAEGNFLA